MKTYSNPRTETIVRDWPSGSRRVEARFWVESNRRGERVCRVTTGKPKRSTYAQRAVIVDGDDGRTYFLQSGQYSRHITVCRGDMKHHEETRHPGDLGYQALVNLIATPPHITETSP